MSDIILKLIPTNPFYIPDPAAHSNAKEFLEERFPEAENIQVVTEQEAVFVDQGYYFEGIICPFCHQEIRLDWWIEAIDTAFESNFSDLKTTVPCCNRETTLNDLDYVTPAGFGKFIIEIKNPGRQLEQDDLHQLEQMIEHKLKEIWARYL